MGQIGIYAEVGADGGCLLFSFDPPGLLARGLTEREALDRVPAGIERLERLLERSGQSRVLPARHSMTPRIEETVRRRGVVANGHTRATFARDLEPVDPREVPPFIEILRAIRAELLALRDAMPEAARTFRSLPHRKTIDEQLRHIAAVDRWYLTHLWSELPRLPRARDVWERLDTCRQLVEQQLSKATARDLTAVRKIGGETWTLRKIMRRLAYHERFHIDTIARDLDLFSAPGVDR